MMEAPRCGPRLLGTRCRPCFWLGLLWDAVGLAILLAGFFVDAFFSDVLIYAGGVLIFFSLLWWVFWYIGNMEVPPDQLQDDVGLNRRGKARGQGLARLFRSLSIRFSGTLASFPGTAATVASAASRKATTDPATTVGWKEVPTVHPIPSTTSTTTRELLTLPT